MYRSTQVTHVLYPDILVCLTVCQLYFIVSCPGLDLTMMHVSLFLYSVSVLLTVTFSDLQDKPKISSKGADLYLSSGTEGNIVFDHSQQGKIFFGVHEL
ncbi:Hypothetical predicted protein, partial [Paramuricea clavata]